MSRNSRGRKHRSQRRAGPSADGNDQRAGQKPEQNSGSRAGSRSGGRASNNNGASDASPSRPLAKGKTSAGASRPAEGESRDSARGKQKKPIKNARSLRDVLTGRAGSAPAPQSSGPAKAKPGQTKPAQTKPDGAAVSMMKSVSKKLQYIMTFRPPGMKAAEPEPEQKPEKKPEQRSERRPEARPEARPATKGRRVPEPAQGKQNKSDSSWPKDRVKAASSAPTERREKSFTKSGKRADHVVTGVVKRHPDGYGFLVTDSADHPDVYIARHSMTGVMTNDRVEAAVHRPKGGNAKDDRYSGEILKVLSRANRNIVGKYLPVDQKYGVILDEGRGWGADLRIATKDSLDAKEGQIVAVEVIQYPGPDNEFTGKVVEVIGDMDNPINDVIRIVHQQGIPNEFSAGALNEARKYGEEVTAAETKGREDLTSLTLITIDGATARDFDDAVYVEKQGTGFRLVVAIADVSHYVKPGTILDQEAYERGTSTYFPNYVVPMLPEELSNELCSIKPKVKRLCFVCEMQINSNGDVSQYRFYEGVMESKARVTYGEAQEVMDANEAGRAGGKGRTPAVQKFKHVEDTILNAAELAKILMAKRFREGSLDLEIPETQVVVDQSGESVDVIKSARLFAHRLIEELMLVTNICTARFMEDKRIPGIFRVHEEPDPDNLQALQRYLWNFGGSKTVTGSDNLQKKLTQALESMAGKPEAQILNILTLRTMRQAHYSKDNVGHFGLGFSQYSHFTSPIRRYPDLIAHRIIKSQLYPKYRNMAMNEEELASATTMLSACEQRSTKAERKVISIKKARFMRKFVGEEFEGIISSVAKFGVFVLLRQFDVDGLVKVERLGNDRFVFDDQNLRLVGNRSGLSYKIGDTIKVIVTGVDVEQGKIDFDRPENLADDVQGASPDHAGGGNERAKGRGRSGPSASKSAVGEKSANTEKKESKRGARKNAGSKKKKAGSAKRTDAQERGEKRQSTQDDSRSVRKKRVSKRRGEN